MSENETNEQNESQPLLDHAISPRDLMKLVDANVISVDQYANLIDSSGIIPKQANWHSFMSVFLLSIGTLFLISGIIFFFAYNWADLDKFHKFAALQTAILIALLFVWRRGLDDPIGHLAATFAVVVIGVLMAVFGQIYQTGADLWELFALWTLVALPVAVVARYTPLWMIWLVLLNAAIFLYVQQELGYGFFYLYYRLGLGIYVAFLLAWELLAYKKSIWMRQPFFIGLLFTACLYFATGLMVKVVASVGNARYLGSVPDSNFINFILYAGTVAVSFYYYQFKKHNLYIAAITYLSLGILPVVYIMRSFRFNAEYFFILGIIIVVEAIVAVVLLRRLQLRWRVKA